MTPPYPNDDDPILLGELSAFPLKPDTEPEGWFKRWSKSFVRFWKKEVGDLPQELARRAATAKVEDLETVNTARYLEAVGNVQVAQSIAGKNDAEAYATRSKAEIDAAERLLKMYAEAPPELKGLLIAKMSELHLHGGNVFVTEKTEVVLEPAQEVLPEMAEES